MAWVYFNEKRIEAPEGTTLKELLELQGRDPDLAVVTVDDKFAPRSVYRTLVPPEGARVTARELLNGG